MNSHNVVYLGVIGVLLEPLLGGVIDVLRSAIGTGVYRIFIGGRAYFT